MTWNDVAKKAAYEIAGDAPVLAIFAGMFALIFGLIALGIYASRPGPEGRPVVRDNRVVCECPEVTP